MGNEDAEEKRLTYRIVMDLQQKFIRVLFDNFYTSVNLLEDLIVHGIYACGTVRSRAREIDKCNRSISSVSDRLFPVKLTEIADWMSISEYMLHSNFGKALIYRREFWCIYLYIAASLFTKYLSIFWDVLSAERILKQNKNTSEFPRINSCYFRRQAHSSSSVRVQSAK